MNTYFISGHRDLTVEEFESNYAPIIIKALSLDSNFVVGDYEGCDIMAQNYLVNTLNVSPEKIKVFHMFTSPRNINPKITQTVGGFTTDVERDSAMTKHSDYDIAFIRPNKYNSGTAQNILRRYELKNLNF